MRALEDRLEEIEIRVKSYEQKLNGLEEVIEKYRTGEITYTGLTYAANSTARVEERLMSEIERFDLNDYYLKSEGVSNETMKQLEKLYGDRLEQLEDRIDYLEDKRRNMFKSTGK